jgi:diaminohydroxyphosphoribosylaminopyrimidine deaminase / 5-amino-6-(5-phosphoribosylamino)uracil reductase
MHRIEATCHPDNRASASIMEKAGISRCPLPGGRRLLMTNHHPTDDDRRWMSLAIELAHLCPPSEDAYSVGAVIVDEHGNEISRGYSRELDARVHAEEAALSKLPANDPQLPSATIYSTLEPCSERRSRPLACTRLILAAGIGRVVIAWREPSLFVADGRGVEMLEAAGVTVIELPEFVEQAKEVNRHLTLEA